MDKQTKHISIISTCVLMLVGIIALPRVSVADELSVTGNGSNSNNNVNVTNTQQTTSQQTNASQIANNTNTTASTGNNSASNSTGNTTIKTGDASAVTTLNNSTNASSVNTGCCQTQGSTAAITGNGSGSNNSVETSSSNNTTVTINQNATITNNVSQNAISGHNEVNNNNGNVLIKTGNVTGQISVTNGLVNNAFVNVPGDSSLFAIKISGNGADSVNKIIAQVSNTNVITVNNTAAIINNLKAKYVTGENSANNNNGSVTIITGNALGTIQVENAVNASQVTILCNCQKEHNKPQAPSAPTPQPTNNNVPVSSNSSTGNSSGSSSGGPGSVLGASANNLPVTGGSYWFFIALIGNILMMLLGGYLRLRSGRSPGYAYVM